ncbi:unnamed protein product [Symbiodinium sp. CCMP2592]|nr:unnamed protein product [Symbiodinium sp. CCMP2592]
MATSPRERGLANSAIELPGECTDRNPGHQAGLKNRLPESADLSKSPQSQKPATPSAGFQKLSCCCAALRSLALRVLGRSAKSFSELAFHSIGPKADVTPLQSKVADVIDFQLKRYLQDRCVGGKSTLHRMAENSAITFSLLLVLPVLSFLVCALIPMEPTQSGFWANWKFNLLAHPVLNYVIARGQLECMSRAFSREDRSRIRWIVRMAPLADSVYCLLAHLIASFAGVYPIPFAPALSCIPGLWCSMALYWRLLPQEILSPEARLFMKFNFFNWGSWLSQFAILVVWMARFPTISEHFQALSAFGVVLLVSFLGWLTQKCADCWGLSKYLLKDIKLCIFFVSLFCSASLMSKTKNIGVVLVITMLDAGKALALLAQLLWDLLQALEVEDGIYGSSDRDPAVATSGQQVLGLHSWQKVQHKLGVARRVGQRLRGALTRIESGTDKDMQTADISPADARLLKILTHCLATLAVMELCELFVPVFYMMMSSLLRAVEGNRTYFLQFRQETTAEFHDGLVGNSIAVAIEAVVFLGMQALLLRIFGINLWEFAGTMIRLDYSFYAFAMSCCFITFLAITIEHFGSWGLMSLVTEKVAGG